MKMFARGIIGELKYYMYRRQKSGAACVFCHSEKTLIAQSDTMLVLENDFPYKRWANQPVEHHLMIIPKRHVLKISELTQDENTELTSLMAAYDEKGYSFYIRSHIDKYRSVGHIHGHLFMYK